MARMKTNQSRVSRAKPDTISVRTTIPAHIASQMGLEDGDTLNWEFDKQNDKWVATIRRNQ